MRARVADLIADLAELLDNGGSWTPVDARSLAAALKQLAVVARWRADAIMLGPGSAFAQRLEEHALVSPDNRAKLWLGMLSEEAPAEGLPSEASQARQALRIEPFAQEHVAPLKPVLPGDEP